MSSSRLRFEKADRDRVRATVEKPAVNGGFGLELGLGVGLMEDDPGDGPQQLLGTLGDIGSERFGAGVLVLDGAEGPTVVLDRPGKSHVRIVAGHDGRRHPITTVGSRLQRRPQFGMSVRPADDRSAA
ncbi:hypothetical protein OHS58_18025 [Amycolatopsis sp. NBC_00348]|uniref:hypothetical protein n=1 Tax=Amycolatopsis sp. NBC_00348 TaxID=2975956 RepID=UPI002E26917A